MEREKLQMMVNECSSIDELHKRVGAEGWELKQMDNGVWAVMVDRKKGLVFSLYGIVGSGNVSLKEW